MTEPQIVTQQQLDDIEELERGGDPGQAILPGPFPDADEPGVSAEVHPAAGSVTELLPSEAARLADLEAVVQRGLSSFVDVGNALHEIREARLYRATHDTFEDYCQERWEFVASRARQLIAAAEVASVTTGNTPPNERQARELVPLLGQPEKLQRAWELASDDGAPTAAKIREVVKRERTKPRRRRPAVDERVQRRLDMEAFDRDLADFERQAHRLVQRAERAVACAMDPVRHKWFGRVRELQRTLDEMERVILGRERDDAN